MCVDAIPHPGVVPLGFELRDLLFLLQQLLPAGVQLLGQCSKLLSDRKKKGKGMGSASHFHTLQQPSMAEGTVM